MTPTDFSHRTLPRVGVPVHRLGLALNDGLDARGFDLAVERGVNFFFYTKLKTGALVPSLRRVIKQNRDKVVVWPPVRALASSRGACAKPPRRACVSFGPTTSMSSSSSG